VGVPGSDVVSMGKQRSQDVGFIEASIRSHLTLVLLSFGKRILAGVQPNRPVTNWAWS
jgi:hypothetical protein